MGVLELGNQSKFETTGNQHQKKINSNYIRFKRG